jgi:hypothetical protein
MKKTLTLILVASTLAIAGCAKSPIASAPRATAQVRVQSTASMKAVEAAIVASFNHYTDLLGRWNAASDEDVRLKLDAEMIKALEDALTKSLAAVKNQPEPKARTVEDLATRTLVAYRPLKAKLEAAGSQTAKREVIQNIYNVVIAPLQQMLKTAQSI